MHTESIEQKVHQSVMDVVVCVNEERFMVSDMREMCEALEEILDERAEIKAIKLAEEMVAEHEKAAESRGMEHGMERGMKQGMKQGISQGIVQGEQQKILTLIQKKIKKGKSVAQIADELEETEETILPLYNRLKAEEGSC